MKDVSSERFRENQNTHFMFNTFSYYRAVYVIRWNYTVQPDRPQMTIRRTPFACWITKATDTHFEYVIPNAFPRQKWLRQ